MNSFQASAFLCIVYTSINVQINSCLPTGKERLNSSSLLTLGPTKKKSKTTRETMEMCALNFICSCRLFGTLVGIGTGNRALAITSYLHMVSFSACSAHHVYTYTSLSYRDLVRRLTTASQPTGKLGNFIHDLFALNRFVVCRLLAWLNWLSGWLTEWLLGSSLESWPYSREKEGQKV